MLLSDLLAPIERLETHLGYLRSQGHEVVVLRILDPVEVTFPFTDAAMFFDLETSRELYVDPDVARETYRRRFAEHAAALATTCNRLGIDLVELTSDRPLELALFDLLHARLKRGRQVSRRQSTGRRPAVAGGR